MKTIYAVLILIGLIFPFSQFIPWLMTYGFNFSLFFQQIIKNPLAAFAWLDVVITVIIIVLMILHDGRHLKIKHLWLPILASFIGGASVGLPLFLYMKQYHIEKLGLKTM